MCVCVHVCVLKREKEKECVCATSVECVDVRVAQGVPVSVPVPVSVGRGTWDVGRDRTMLGRSFWTYMHTLSVYMDHDPEAEAVARYKAIFDVINNIYACPVCKGHFQKFYPDPIIQQEHKEIASKHDCIMFTWKIHNIVTADGINRDEVRRRLLLLCPHTATSVSS